MIDKLDGIVKSPDFVMPDPGSSSGQALIRHPYGIEKPGFRLEQQVANRHCGGVAISAPSA
jgi:hypothetical protein